MKILGISARYDAAGDDWRTKLAFDRHSEWQYRSAIRRPLEWDYPRDLPWSHAAAEWRKADVIHAALGFEAEALLHVPRRPTVVHHHGIVFKKQRDRLLREQADRHAIGLVSTLDLYLMAPDELNWSPSPYDLDWLATFAKPKDDGILRIAHSPTSRTLKSTEPFLAACERLAREVRLEVILIEHAPWLDTLRRKGQADIFFDQAILGYGCNAVEAWGMGLPVVAGGAPDTLAEIDKRAGGLPFVMVDEGTIYEGLRRLVEPSERERWAETGLGFARRFHADAVVVSRLQRVFEIAR